MIIACLNRDALVFQEITDENQNLLKEAVWIDLIKPTKKEGALVDKHLNLDLPTRAEMVEIEISSRLYKEANALYMTANMIAQSDTPEAQFDAVTFVVSNQQLTTIRYIEPLSIRVSIGHIKKFNATQHDAISILIELLETTIDRLADTLELVGKRLDDYSKTIFRPLTETSQPLDYRQLLTQIGANGELNTKVRESLVTFIRLITFFTQSAQTQINNDHQLRLATLSKDIASLSDHANFLSNKVNFLLDATLGLVSIEQNNIIKIFSVAAVIFLPPTLVASIYGMNFRFMPELSWRFGYIFAIGLIIVAAWTPYKYFKHKKWL
tara:strand:+ start:476 stop:1447 length:972 start_codon:yes stop_codon:yes gene_type:complete